MTALYREFVLNGPSDAAAMLAFVKSNAGPLCTQGTPLRGIFTTEELDRLDEQIRYYFGVVVKAITEQVWLEGRRFGKDAWHEQLARQFLPGKELLLPDGEIIIKRDSIARGQISVKRMAQFTQEVEAYAATELGVQFDAAPVGRVA